VEWGIERGTDLGKGQTLRAALIRRKGLRHLPLILLRPLPGLLFDIAAVRPMRQSMRNAHLLGEHQQKRQQGKGNGTA